MEETSKYYIINHKKQRKMSTKFEQSKHRKALVEIVIHSVAEHYMYNNLNDFQIGLERQLKSDLKFKTTMLELGIKNGFTFGKILFDYTDDDISVIHFTITPTSPYSVKIL